jgi:DNA polymerase III epsilon subunit family exonuclease
MMGPTGVSLAQRAAERLAAGPIHTLQLARDVLGLTGHPGAASQAVFTLLGRDERFEVDERGMWRLLDVRRVPGPPLSDVGFAVVDVETTGGSFDQGHRIIEIAVVEVRGGAIVDEWRTLVNPGRTIAFFVQDLTGIRTDMVIEAPHFEHVAAEVQRRIEGRIFVAHNATFDWRFVSTELVQALGVAPDVPRLCTVKLVRCLLPRLKRRNLDAVTAHFGLRIHERHRAYGDALATARVLVRLLDEAASQGITDLEALVDRMRHQRRRRRHRRRGGAAARARRELDALQGELLDGLTPRPLLDPLPTPRGPEPA